MFAAHHCQNRLLSFALAMLLLFAVSAARADPPARVARLGYASGQVSFSPAGEADWVQATLNRPLTTGDQLWADAHSRAELQIGGAAIRLGENTNLTISRLDDDMAQVELLQGSLKVRIRQISLDQIFEVDTPNLSFSLRQAGDYRIDVDPRGDATAVKVDLGQAVVDSDGASYTIDAGQTYRFYGTGLSDYEVASTAPEDELDRWSRDREARFAGSDSGRYVSYDVVGYEDLDAYGAWRYDPRYGNVWWPRQVAAGWTPYRNGHWTWIDPWGWNWVDDAPWGYAVSHYGRWAHVNGAWGWVPGPRHERAVFAPALVVFLGSTNLESSSFGDDQRDAIGWFPLAPLEVYQPTYQVSRTYFDRVNRSNAVIASITLGNVFQARAIHGPKPGSYVPQQGYMNRRVAGAVVAAPVRVFSHSQPVTRSEPRLSREFANRGDLRPVVPVAPTIQRRHDGAPEARSKPPVNERRIVTRTVMPAPAAAWTTRQVPLAQRPRIPADDPQHRLIRVSPPSDSIRSVTINPKLQPPTPVAKTPVLVPKERPPVQHMADPVRSTAQPVPTLRAAPVRSFANPAMMVRKPEPQMPSGNVEGDNNRASRVNKAREAAAQAAVVKDAARPANPGRARAASAEEVKAQADRAHAAPWVPPPEEAQAQAPRTRDSAPRPVRKHNVEGR